MSCLLLAPVSQIEGRKDEESERRESDTERREDMADEERQGEFTSAIQQSREPPTRESQLLKQLKKQENIIKKNRAALRKVKQENAVLKRTMKIKDKKIKKLLTKDQIGALGRLTTRGMKWSNDTVKKALKLRFAAGSTGYKALQDLQIPLPGIRILQRRMQAVRFEPGVLTEVFDFLKLKASGFTDLERKCVLTIDEMAIISSVELHTLSGKLYGDVTLPGHTGVATHACVFMLAGNTTRWRQVVAFHFSGNSTNGAVYRPITSEIIQRASSTGLHVMNITTDMGSPKQAMWKSFGVDHNTTLLPHPAIPDMQLFFMPDVPHLIKNLKSALIRGHAFVIHSEKKKNLPSNQVSVVPIKDLVAFQEGMTLKIAPHLTAAAIGPSHFEKMKAGSALNVFSRATSAGLKYMVQQENCPLSYLTPFLKEHLPHLSRSVFSYHHNKKTE